MRSVNANNGYERLRPLNQRINDLIFSRAVKKKGDLKWRCTYSHNHHRNVLQNICNEYRIIIFTPLFMEKTAIKLSTIWKTLHFDKFDICQE